MLVDKPVEGLRVYTVTNLWPADFDSHLDRALAELEATPPDVEIRVVPFWSSVKPAPSTGSLPGWTVDSPAKSSDHL